MMNVSGVGVNSLSLLKASSKAGMTNAIAASASSAEAAVGGGKLGSIANKAWQGVKNLGIKAWEKGIKPAAQWIWNKALKPAGEFVWNKAIKPVGNLAAKAGKAVYNKALKPAGLFLWNKALVPAGKAIAKAGKVVFEKVLKPAGEAIANAAKKVVGKSGDVIGAVKSMPKGAKIGIVAAGIALVAAGITALVKNHKAKQAEQAEAV